MSACPILRLSLYACGMGVYLIFCALTQVFLMPLAIDLLCLTSLAIADVPFPSTVILKDIVRKLDAATQRKVVEGKS